MIVSNPKDWYCLISSFRRDSLMNSSFKPTTKTFPSVVEIRLLSISGGKTEDHNISFWNFEILQDQE